MRIGLLMRPTYVDGNDVDVNRFKREVSAEPDDVCLLNAGATGRCGCRFRHEVPENRLACLEGPRRRLRGPSLLPPVRGMGVLWNPSEGGLVDGATWRCRQCSSGKQCLCENRPRWSRLGRSGKIVTLNLVPPMSPA